MRALAFNVDGFVRMIKDRGLPVRWEKAMLCGNRVSSPQPGDHDPNCDVCDGSGYLYIQPRETQMLVQGATLEQTFFIQGKFDSGVATITSLPEDKISYWDRVTLTKSTVRYTELVRRREDTFVDRLRYETLDVLHVQHKKKTFIPVRDFRVEGDTLIWTKNDKVRPKDGEFYSILIERRPVYIVLNMLKHHRDQHDGNTKATQSMPLQVTAKLDFIVRDESKEKAPLATPVSPFAQAK